MTWQDRDYLEEGSSGRTSLWANVRRPPRATLTLMILHGAAFLVLISVRLGGGSAPSAALALRGGAAQPWGIMLHPFATTSLLTALFTVLALWSLGGRLENRLGVGPLLAVYFLGNLLAGAVFFAIARAQTGLALLPLDYPIGALTAMVALAWSELRNEPTQVFGRATNVAKVYLVCAAIVIGLALITSGAQAAAWLAALFVGALAAPLVAHCPRSPFRRRRARRVRPSIPRTPASAEYDIDDLLAKISRAGMGALTRRELKRLEAARRAKLERSLSQVRPGEPHNSL